MSQELHEDIKHIKQELKDVHEKLNILIDKISEFEVVLDAADMIEESLQDNRAKEEDNDIWGSNSWETSLEDDEDEDGGVY
jgi:hypothetical protein